MRSNVVQLPRSDQATLVEQARAGDRQAFEALVAQEIQPVTKLLARLVGNDADVPDLVNEVLLLGWKRLLSSALPIRFGAFLSGVCVNVARNHLRSRRRRRWLVFGEEADAMAAERTDPREALSATYAVLRRLDPELQVAFALRYIDGRELTEVAELMDVSIATVKRKLVKAEKDFADLARGYEVLLPWLSRSERWGTES